MKELSLLDGLDLPPCLSLEFSRLITLIFSKGTFLVYKLQVPLLESTMYQIYKIQPFPYNSRTTYLCIEG
jgi:hypothetical protein